MYSYQKWTSSKSDFMLKKASVRVHNPRGRGKDMRTTRVIVGAAIAAALTRCGTMSPPMQEGDSSVEAAPSNVKGGENMAEITISSSAFTPEGEIPTKHTCQGDDASVPLTWSAIPDGAESLALIVDDPDAPDPEAPKTVWVHWVLYNLPVTATGLEEAVTDLPEGTLAGKNDWGKTGWGGPCPPIGRHRYYFKIYALDTVLPDLGEPTKAELLEAMEGHVIAQGELMGTYQK